MSVQIFGPSASPPGASGSRSLLATIPAGGGAHRYWRIYVTATWATWPQPCIGEIELRSSVGGADLTGSGTASASAVEGGNVAGNAVDNNTGTFWGTYPATVPQWWAYDFGSGVSHAIIEIRITPRADAFWESVPASFQWEYSDDGSTWTQQGSFSVSWPSSAAQTISVAPGADTLVYGVLAGTAGRYLDIKGAALPSGAARLEFREQFAAAGTASYTKLLLTGSVYGATYNAGWISLSIGGFFESEGGGGGGGAQAWFGANRIIYMYRRNVSGQNLAFVLLNATTGAGLTGATVAGYRSIDGGAQTAVSGAVSEKANGQYNLALSSADCNGNHIGFLFVATGAVPASLAIVTTVDDPTTGTAAAVWAYAVETSWSALEATRIMLSALAGKVTGANTTSIAFRDVGDTKNRISATVDQYGNRNVVTIDKT